MRAGPSPSPILPLSHSPILPLSAPPFPTLKLSHSDSLRVIIARYSELLLEM